MFQASKMQEIADEIQNKYIGVTRNQMAGKRKNR